MSESAGPITAAVGQEPDATSAQLIGSAKQLAERLRPHRAMLALFIGLTAGAIGFGVLGPRILGHATDLLFNGVLGRRLPSGITKEQAIEAARARGDNTFADLLSHANVVPGRGIEFGAVAETLAIALAIYVAAASFIWIKGLLLNAIVQRTVATLRSDVENKLHRLPLSYYDSHQRGELLSRATNDIDNIETSLWLTINPLLTALLTLLPLLTVMLSISPVLVAITLLTVPLSLLATRMITPRARERFTAKWAMTGQLNAHIEVTYSGLALVRTFGQRQRARQKFRELNTQLYRADFGAELFSGLLSPATMFIGNLNYVVVAVLGGLQVASGQITLGSVQAFIQYMRQFNQSVVQIAALYFMVQSGLVSAERVFELLNAPEEEPDSESTSLPAEESGRCGLVEFQHVSFSYRPGIPVIKALSLVANPGDHLAIVGSNGSGKTTLVNLLMRFHEVDSGRILIDGVDISSVSRHSLRSRFGMVLQDSWLFGGTISENIGYGRPEASREEIVAAARAACVDTFVEMLPEGYDTLISEDGGNLSAGQKQLITIARAFLANPQILILDEATSAVDTQTELLIRQATSELRRDRTSFVIAHRLSTVRDADSILVMRDGAIVERGSHEELLSLRGVYYAMTQV